MSVPLGVRWLLGAHVVVVRNDSVSRRDRTLATAAAPSSVISFKHMASWQMSERVDVRVVRRPSSFGTAFWPGVPVWRVAVEPPADGNIMNRSTTLVYEPQYGDQNALLATARIFPSCDHCRGRYHHNATGAVILSALEEWSPVHPTTLQRRACWQARVRVARYGRGVVRPPWIQSTSPST